MTLVPSFVWTRVPAVKQVRICAFPSLNSTEAEEKGSPYPLSSACSASVLQMPRQAIRACAGGCIIMISF
ncbi:MAG: hypothetical protein O9310_10600 [Leptospiraceae bacterium]|nr:hypothetical protein [Leptospiraceae bacterium]